MGGRDTIVGRGAPWAAAVVAALAAAGPAQASTSAEAVAALNAQRAAHGIPAGIVEDPEYSEGCRLHMAYEAINGRSPTNPHSEDPALPGYTELGHRAAASSVLGGPSDSWAGGNPWEDAPIHLMDTLAPALAETGWAPGCMWTVPTEPRLGPPDVEVVTYPGPGATIYPSHVAREAPFVPGDFVGLPEGTRTGPHLMLMPFGEVPPPPEGVVPGPTRIERPALAGPMGPVDVRAVDQATTGAPGNLGTYLEGAMMIPAAPLLPGTAYTASARLLVQGHHPVDVAWTFRTAGPDSGLGDPVRGLELRRPRVRIAGVARSRSRVTVRVVGAEAVGQTARFIIRRRGKVCPAPGRACRVRLGRPTVRRVTLRPLNRIVLPRLRHGHRVEVRSPGFTAPEARYRGVRIVRVVR